MLAPMERVKAWVFVLWLVLWREANQNEPMKILKTNLRQFEMPLNYVKYTIQRLIAWPLFSMMITFGTDLEIGINHWNKIFISNQKNVLLARFELGSPYLSRYKCKYDTFQRFQLRINQQGRPMMLHYIHRHHNICSILNKKLFSQGSNTVPFAWLIL